MLKYIIQPGDSLHFIGLKFKVSAKTIMELNGIGNPNMIYPGQVINIPMPYAPSGDTGNFPVIRQGSSGPFVLLVQGQLNKFGFYNGAMDGIYGVITEGCLTQYQASRNLRPTGIVDAYTWKKLIDEDESSLNSPPFQARMVLSGLLMILSVDKPSFDPNEKMVVSLYKINLSSTPITLNYNTGQRYDFKITYPSGKSIFKWSEDKNFTQVLGTHIITPGQSVRYTETLQLTPLMPVECCHIYAWNTARQINHIKLYIPVLMKKSK